MNENLRRDAEEIVRHAIAAVLPDRAVERALAGMAFPGRVYVVAAGKAAWQMSRAAVECLKTPISGGVCVTKYGHVMGPIAGIECIEAGHPVPDENSFAAKLERKLAPLTNKVKETGMNILGKCKKIIAKIKEKFTKY